jgi:serine protease inhibitor
MRKKKWFATCAMAFAVMTFSSSCSGIGGDLLVKPAKAESLEYTAYNEESFLSFKSQAEQFSAKLASGIYQRSEKDDNLSVAPNSVFMALSLVAECAGGTTKSELLNALGVSEDAIK